MSELSEPIRRHLEALADETRIQPREEALARVLANWQAKRRLYEEQTEALSMVAEDLFAVEDPRGVLVLTRSGSLVALAPPVDGGRALEYASISIRTDVPPLVQADRAVLQAAVQPGDRLALGGCPIETTSEALEVRTFDRSVTADEQARRLREAMIFLTNGFVRENYSLSLDLPAGIEHFTMRGIVASIAARTGQTQRTIRTIIDDYLTTVEAGILLGERVSLGRIGTLRLSTRGARKARLGRNPSTGEEMLLPARGETAVPRVGFSGRLKARAALVPPERVGGGEKDEPAHTDDDE